MTMSKRMMMECYVVHAIQGSPKEFVVPPFSGLILINVGNGITTSVSL